MARLNHGQTRTRYEHEVNNARDAYVALLIAHTKNLIITPELNNFIQKVYRASRAISIVQWLNYLRCNKGSTNRNMATRRQ